MYDAKKIIDISNALIKGYSDRYDKYLDDRRTEWSKLVDTKFRQEPPGDQAGDVEATKRLIAFRKIVTENESYCRRDMDIPDLEFSNQLDRIAKFKELRDAAGIEEPFPGLLAEHATLFMLKHRFKEDYSLLDDAIKINDRYPELIVKRDNVRYQVDQVRCLYMTSEYHESIKLADTTRVAASEIDGTVEKAEWERGAAAPGLQFVPINVHAYFAACDARVHQPDWSANERLRREFSGLWSDSVTKYNVPRIWRTPMKIAAVSDAAWVGRTESYVHDIAQQLYIELSDGPAQRAVRLIRAKWGGFQITYPKTAVAAAATLVFLAVGTSNIDNWGQVFEATGTYVERELPSVRTKPLEQALGEIFREIDQVSIEEFIKENFDHPQLLASKSGSIASAMSGSEGSVVRI